jgi:uncharacterized membrane protein YfcA
MSRGRLVQLALVGAAAGLFSGLFGVGGGVVIVPLLVLWLLFDERTATGTSLLAIAAVAAAGAVVQEVAYGNVLFWDGVLVGLPAVAGVVFGVWLQHHIPAAMVRILFAVLLVATAIALVAGSGWDGAAGSGGGIGYLLAAAAIGLAAGVLSGLLGVGGGAFFVPALILVLGHDQLDAEATSLLAIIPVSLVGAWRQHRYGNLDHRAGLVIGATAIPFAVLGVFAVNSVPPRAVEVAFALLLLYVAWQMARGGLAELREGREAAGGPPGSG